MTRIFRLAAAVGLALAAGCADPTPEKLPVRAVTGTATRATGKPAYHVQIVLRPVGKTDPNAVRPSALTAADGTFSLGTYTVGDGIPEGEYAVAAYDGSGAPQQVVRPATVAVAAGTTELPTIVLK